MRELLSSSLLVAVACQAPAPRVSVDALWPDLATTESGAVRRDDLFRARSPSREVHERLIDAQTLYLAGDDAGFAERRDRLARDPLAAFWLARMLIRFALVARDRAAAEPDAMVAVPPWQRATDHLVAMGDAAVPCVVLDLLAHRQADRREFGVLVLQSIGPRSLAAWRAALAVDEVRVRRAGVEAVANLDPSLAAVAILRERAADADFGVRAAAYRGLARAGRAATAELVAALERETDPFVQRAIVEALAAHPTRAAATAVLRFFEQSAARGDARSAQAARETLVAMSADPSASVDGWRAWLATLPVDLPDEPRSRQE
jgi:hypothetical protein